jgi:DNA ligase-1
MKRFARLYSAIDSTTSTNKKVDAMVEYFSEAPPADAAWAVYFLSGGRPKRLIPVRRIATWAMEESGVPDWLFEESYNAVGDLAETIALLLPLVVPSEAKDLLPLHEWVEKKLLPLATISESEQRTTVIGAWRQLDSSERYIWNKLITGSFRVGVSEQLVVRALARASGVEEGVIAHRLSGHWAPTASNFSALIERDSSDADRSRPFPFYLA